MNIIMLWAKSSSFLCNPLGWMCSVSENSLPLACCCIRKGTEQDFLFHLCSLLSLLPLFHLIQNTGARTAGAANMLRRGQPGSSAHPWMWWLWSSRWMAFIIKKIFHWPLGFFPLSLICFLCDSRGCRQTWQECTQEASRYMPSWNLLSVLIAFSL